MRGRLALVVAGSLLATCGVASGAAPAKPAAPVFQVGAAVVGINPRVTVYSGGFGASPPIKPGSVIGPPLTVRALYISNGRQAVELALVDAQAEFAAYQEGPQYGITAARNAAASAINAAHDGPRISAGNIIIQATHSHSAPTLEGLWGPVPTPYLKAVTQAERQALVQAAANAKPAVLRFGTADASALDLVDGRAVRRLPRLGRRPAAHGVAGGQPQDRRNDRDVRDRARSRRHRERRADPAPDDRLLRVWCTTPLQRQLGGISIVGPGTLGREETPVQATDIAEDHVFAANVLSLVDGALASARPVTSDRIAAAERMVQIPGTGALLLALVAANHFPLKQKQQVQNVLEYPIDRADTPPYQTGLDVGTPLTALRVGNIAYVSMPGEPFPEVRNTLEVAAQGATVVALSKGQDDLGYFYPAYVTPFTEIYPSDTFTNSASAVTGDAVIAGQESNLDALGFATRHRSLAPVPVQPLQALYAGLQVIGGPFVTDAGANGKARVRMIATYAPPDLPSATTADGLPAGSFDYKENPTGKVHWSFGAITGYHNFSGDDLEPYIVTHSFGVGVHHVTARILDADGFPVTTSFTVRVYPHGTR